MRNLGCPRRRGKLRAWWIGLCRRNRLETYPKLLSEDAMAEYSAVEEEGSTSGISGNIVGRVQESDVLEGPDGINCTEFGNAERVLLAHREELAWISGTTAQSAGTFYHFDGQRWQRDDAGRVRELVK